ncbi:MAG: hypothetical protein JW729_06625 [Bacteroidales bacterium]|nr:hypothetical protein [Bacteroidales bacterium]
MDNYSITSFPNQEADGSLIKVKGELSIHYIAHIKKSIDAEIKNKKNIELVIYDASIIDLTMLQYLHSLKKSEKELGKNIKVTFQLDDDLSDLLKHAGFNYIENTTE